MDCGSVTNFKGPPDICWGLFHNDFIIAHISFLIAGWCLSVLDKVREKNSIGFIAWETNATIVDSDASATNANDESITGLLLLVLEMPFLSDALINESESINSIIFFENLEIHLE